jgi:hypothetical protein
MAIDGTYQIELDTPMGKQQAKLVLKTDGATLTGSTDSSFGLHTLSNGTVNGDQLTWQTEIMGPMGQMELTYQGKVTGDEISGKVKLGNFGTSDFSGKRV